MRQPRYKAIFADKPGWAEVAIARWKVVKAHLEAGDLVTPAREAAADRYARALTEYEFLYQAALEVDHVQKGPGGGWLYSMHWAAVDKLNARLDRFEAALLIAPRDAVGKVADDGKAKSRAPTAASEFLSRPN